jgi:hypothetical protein
MTWDNKNGSCMVSDHGTAGDSRKHDETGVSWGNYSGTKNSHDVQVNQMNSKDMDGNHSFYSPKSGKQGQAGGNRNK